ncbi:MAG TPA: CapA family protein [Gemmatimonadaceae bacterium]|nr:CapA family protein [Gemmatimonadaceae bacterium]
MNDAAAPASHRPVMLGFAGDVMLGRLVNDIVRENGWAYPWGDLPPMLQTLDAFFINLECALTRRVEKWRNGYVRPFHFRADPEAVEALRAGRVDFAGIANNHIGDFGLDGLLDTIATLDRARIAHAGAGRDLGAARAAAVVPVHGLRVAVVAFADYPDTWAAGESTPGLNFTPVSVADEHFAPVADAIARARHGADLVVLSMHWGPNMREHPPEAFRHFAHRVIDAGVTIFWGHSAHILQGIEFRNHGVILYDTGDFIDDYAVDPELRNDLGALFVVRALPHAVAELSLVPVHIDHMRVNRATGADRTWVVRRMEVLCGEFGSHVEEHADGSVRVLPAAHVLARTAME